jgi:acetylornithine deacetylase/succinyl-diaminopimelate desuccinylase-like protein
MTPTEALPKVLDHIDADLDNSLARLFEFLRIQSISTDPAYAGQCKAAAQFVAKDLETLGLKAEVRPTGGHPVVVARSESANGGPRVMFYGHYDVQPVDPLELWKTPPFEPRIEDLGNGRKIIVARGACDDKGQVMTFIEACRAYKHVTGKLPLDITVMIEGEEECGSKSLFPFLEKHADEFKLDLALVCDTGMWNASTPSVTTSLRGLVYEEVTITAADRDLHSGLFGGAAQNPINVLCRIIAALHDKDGRVTIPGFYDGVPELPDDIRADLKALNLTPEEFLGQVGLSVPAGEKDRMLIEMISTRPTCDVNGIIGGYTGEGAKTVIAAQAKAKVSFRLVGDQDPEKIRDAFRAFVRERLPADCSVTFENHGCAPALQLPFDSPAIVKTRKALQDEWGVKAVTVGSGGSIPVVGDFKRVLGMDSLMVGFALDDDRVHSPNEKYDLKSFHKGTRSWARILDSGTHLLEVVNGILDMSKLEAGDFKVLPEKFDPAAAIMNASSRRWHNRLLEIV